jgi:hypothetical protein
MIDRNTNNQITDKALASAKPELSAAFLMAGKYHYSKGGASEIITKDTPIEEQVDLGEYIAVKIKGFDYGSFAVFDRKKILPKPRTRNIVYRKKPCSCQRVGWEKTEWMAGVPIYCKTVDDGGACPLIKQTANLFECNYEKALVKDYIKICNLNGIEVERITISI